ncbi:hypothetical protein HDV00_008045 [Rhizophlyctis rosea]|nr:hypothetical protein HDV00_008045 [Rhizophlyctis rosea]
MDTSTTAIPSPDPTAAVGSLASPNAAQSTQSSATTTQDPATSAPTQPTTTSTASEPTPVPDFTPPISTPALDTADNSNIGSAGLHLGSLDGGKAIAVVSVLAVVGAILLASCVFCLCWMVRKRRKNGMVEDLNVGDGVANDGVPMIATEQGAAEQGSRERLDQTESTQRPSMGELVYARNRNFPSRRPLPTVPDLEVTPPTPTTSNRKNNNSPVSPSAPEWSTFTDASMEKDDAPMHSPIAATAHNPQTSRIDPHPTYPPSVTSQISFNTAASIQTAFYMPHLSTSSRTSFTSTTPSSQRPVDWRDIYPDWASTTTRRSDTNLSRLYSTSSIAVAPGSPTSALTRNSSSSTISTTRSYSAPPWIVPHYSNSDVVSELHVPPPVSGSSFATANETILTDLSKMEGEDEGQWADRLIERVWGIEAIEEVRGRGKGKEVGGVEGEVEYEDKMGDAGGVEHEGDGGKRKSAANGEGKDSGKEQVGRRSTV